jgi:hypothetical protein
VCVLIQFVVSLLSTFAADCLVVHYSGGSGFRPRPGNLLLWQVFLTYFFALMANDGIVVQINLWQLASTPCPVHARTVTIMRHCIIGVNCQRCKINSYINMSRDSSVSIVTRLRAGLLRDLFSTTCRPAVAPTQPPLQYRGFFSRV